jgi:hypothetical protein
MAGQAPDLLKRFNKKKMGNCPSSYISNQMKVSTPNKTPGRTLIGCEL